MRAIYCKEGRSRPKAFLVKSMCLWVALSAGAASANAEQSKLVGVWKNEIQLVDCTSGQELAPPGIAVHTYYADGNLLQASAINPAEGSPAQGRWAKAGKNQFMARTRDFRFDVNGFYSGYVILERMITLANGGKNLQFSARGSFYSVDDQYLGMSCAVGNGVKLPEPTPF